MKWAELFATCHGLFRRAGLATRTFSIHLHEGIQLWIQFLNAGEMRFYQFNRRELFLADLFSHGNG